MENFIIYFVYKQMVVKIFMDMDQDFEEEKEFYLNLVLYFVLDFFFKYFDKDVRLLVVCCFVDIFRIYVFEVFYIFFDKLKVSIDLNSC